MTTPSLSQLKAAVEAHGRNAPAKLRKEFGTFTPAAIVAMLDGAVPGWNARAKVHHELTAVPKPVGKSKTGKVAAGE